MISNNVNFYQTDLTRLLKDSPPTLYERIRDFILGLFEKVFGTVNESHKPHTYSKGPVQKENYSQIAKKQLVKDETSKAFPAREKWFSAIQTQTTN